MKKISNAAEIDAQIDAAKDLSGEARAELAMNLVHALKDATGLRGFNDLQRAGGDVTRIHTRCLVELLGIPATKESA